MSVVGFLIGFFLVPIVVWLITFAFSLVGVGTVMVGFSPDDVASTLSMFNLLIDGLVLVVLFFMRRPMFWGYLVNRIIFVGTFLILAGTLA